MLCFFVEKKLHYFDDFEQFFWHDFIFIAARFQWVICYRKSVILCSFPPM